MAVWATVPRNCNARESQISRSGVWETLDPGVKTRGLRVPPGGSRRLPPGMYGRAPGFCVLTPVPGGFWVNSKSPRKFCLLHSCFGPDALYVNLVRQRDMARSPFAWARISLALCSRATPSFVRRVVPVFSLPKPMRSVLRISRVCSTIFTGFFRVHTSACATSIEPSSRVWRLLWLWCRAL